MQTRLDAVIVGAGPAGASAAILLARAGWSVALVEKTPFPRRKVCGECISAGSFPLLEALGLGPAIQASAGADLRQVAWMRGNRSIVAPLPAAAHAIHLWGRALGRESLDTLLLAQARAAGAAVWQPWAVQSIEGSAGDWRFEMRGQGPTSSVTLRAPVAILALGSWEPLPAARPRRRLARRAGDLFAFKANFRQAPLDEGLLPVLSFDGGYGGMVVADRGLTTLACCIRPDRLDACRRASPGLGAGEVIEDLLRRECAGVHTALRGAQREGPWLAAGPLATGIHLRADDAMFRIGNAAGEAHPIIGEGMSMALQSAALLCAHLLERGHPANLSDAAWQREVAHRYAAQWRRAFGPRLRRAALLAHLAIRPASANLLMALVHRWPGLLTLGARWSGKARSAAVPPGARASSPTTTHTKVYP